MLPWKLSNYSVTKEQWQIQYFEGITMLIFVHTFYWDFHKLNVTFFTLKYFLLLDIAESGETAQQNAGIIFET